MVRDLVITLLFALLLFLLFQAMDEGVTVTINETAYIVHIK